MQPANPKFNVDDLVIIQNYKRRSKEKPDGVLQKARIKKIKAIWLKETVRIGYEVEVEMVSRNGFDTLHLGEEQLEAFNFPTAKNKIPNLLKKAWDQAVEDTLSEEHGYKRATKGFDRFLKEIEKEEKDIAW